MLNSDNVTQFFEDIKHMLSNSPSINQENNIRSNLEGVSELTKEINDDKGSQRTNVIYLNTDCNLRCEYCYESSSRDGLPDQTHLTTEGIDEFLQEIAKRESDTISTIVIMGGEPFLRFDLVQYIVARSLQFPDKQWGISLITNGTLFTSKRIKKLKELFDLCDRYKRTHLSVEVSYDGSGQSRRPWPDGSSSGPVVEEALDKLIDHNIPFGISYTVHGDNCDFIIQDSIKIFERWPYINKLVLSFAFEDLDKKFNKQNSGQDLQKRLHPYLKELYNIYKIPICAMVCGLCQLCDKANFTGNSYLSPTTGISYDKKVTEHKFQQF